MDVCGCGCVCVCVCVSVFSLVCSGFMTYLPLYFFNIKSILIQLDSSISNNSV